MYQGYILNLNRSDNSILHRLRSILQSNLNCRVTVLNEDDAFAKNGRKPPPNLIFLLADKPDINWKALPFDLNWVPTIMVLSAENSSNKTSDDLPCQIDDVIIPPFKDIEVIWKSRRLLKKRSPGKTPAIKESLLQELGLNNIIGKNPAFLKTLTKIPLLADSNATLLITGETGVGKELVARATHYLSPRQNKSFVSINCGAIPASLVENELFGHKRGAFTDARTNQIGMVAEAEGGTVFLDEIESLSLEAQGKLLRLLQERTYKPLGYTKQVKADIRFIAATNVDLKVRIKDGRFRPDLFYRLNIAIDVPPLRKRKEDIPLLANHILKKHSKEHTKGSKNLAPAALAKLINYDWPGNIRELENVLLEAFLLTQTTAILTENINIPITDNNEFFENLSLKEAKKKVVTQFERNFIINLLIQHQGNICHAAKEAQKDRSDFGKLIQKYQIDARTFRNKNL